MNTSTKFAGFSLLAACSLGVAIFSACTVNSSTNPDTDGGTVTVPTDSATTPTGTTTVPTGTTTCDLSADAGGVYRTQTCMDCLAAKCCTQLQACATAGSTATASCIDYANCTDTCDADDAGADASDDCIRNTCGVSGEAVANAWDQVSNCGNGGSDTATPSDTNCLTECDQP